MKKQIEEMRKDVAIIHRFFLEDDDYEILDDYIADMLFNKGYRKESDVAREIFDEFHNMLLKFVSDFDDGLEKANDKATTVLLDCARETILLVILSLAGLKKKYISEDTNVTTHMED